MGVHPSLYLAYQWLQWPLHTNLGTNPSCLWSDCGWGQSLSSGKHYEGLAEDL